MAKRKTMQFSGYAGPNIHNSISTPFVVQRSNVTNLFIFNNKKIIFRIREIGPRHAYMHAITRPWHFLGLHLMFIAIHQD